MNTVNEMLKVIVITDLIEFFSWLSIHFYVNAYINDVFFG